MTMCNKSESRLPDSGRSSHGRNHVARIGTMFEPSAFLFLGAWHKVTAKKATMWSMLAAYDADFVRSVKLY